MASDLNVWVGIGRLTRDASLTYTSSGIAVCKFDIAVNRKKKSGDQYVDEVSFFTVVLWGKAGESLNQYLTKGKQVAVDGELKQDRWEQDGKKQSKVHVIANTVQLLDGGTPKGDSGQGGGQGSGHSSVDAARAAAGRDGSDAGYGDDGDIPF